MSRADLLAGLAERCEAAEGADRELDGEIAVSVLGMDRDGTLFHSPDETFVLERDFYDHEGSARELPAYTASLDAAMTLVPEGLCLRIGVGTLLGKFSAVTEIVRGNAAELLTSFTGDTVATGDAATPALALTAAALRARAAGERP